MAVYYYYLFLDGTKIKKPNLKGNALFILECQHGKLVRKEKA